MTQNTIMCCITSFNASNTPVPLPLPLPLPIPFMQSYYGGIDPKLHYIGYCHCHHSHLSDFYLYRPTYFLAHLILRIQMCYCCQKLEISTSGADSLGSGFFSSVIGCDRSAYPIRSVYSITWLRIRTRIRSQENLLPLNQWEAQKSAPERIHSRENLLPREFAPICHVICLSQSEAQNSLGSGFSRERILSGADSLGSGFSRERIREQILIDR